MSLSRFLLPLHFLSNGFGPSDGVSHSEPNVKLDSQPLKCVVQFREVDVAWSQAMTA